jgi:hypothetical protein
MTSIGVTRQADGAIIRDHLCAYRITPHGDVDPCNPNSAQPKRSSLCHGTNPIHARPTERAIGRAAALLDSARSRRAGGPSETCASDDDQASGGRKVASLNCCKSPESCQGHGVGSLKS